MSKLKCICGHSIIDQTINLPYKGKVIPDQELENMFNCQMNIVKSIIRAKEENNLDEWIKTNFQVPPYPTDIPMEHMVHDIFSTYLFNKMKDIYQCENCGRLILQKNKTEQFVYFRPESEDWKDMLIKIKE